MPQEKKKGEMGSRELAAAGGRREGKIAESPLLLSRTIFVIEAVGSSPCGRNPVTRSLRCSFAGP